METTNQNNNIESAILPESKLTKSQKKTNTIKTSDGGKLKIEIRFDDECGNKHNSFAITADYWSPERVDRREPDSCGCQHDLIIQEYPELAKYIKWHLCSTDGPMHYIANTTFHAGNLDCWGRSPGQPSRFEYGIRFNGSKVTHSIPAKFAAYLKAQVENGVKTFEVVTIPHTREPKTFSPNYSINDFTQVWHEAPFKDITSAAEFTEGLNTESFELVKLAVEFSTGKERDFDAARHCAIWPEATEEQLSLPKEELTKLLNARLPGLMAEFKADMEELGFTY
jgi:hypothetical protein